MIGLVEQINKSPFHRRLFSDIFNTALPEVAANPLLRNLGIHTNPAIVTPTLKVHQGQPARIFLTHLLTENPTDRLNMLVDLVSHQATQIDQLHYALDQTMRICSDLHHWMMTTSTSGGRNRVNSALQDLQQPQHQQPQPHGQAQQQQHQGSVQDEPEEEDEIEAASQRMRPNGGGGRTDPMDEPTGDLPGVLETKGGQMVMDGSQDEIDEDSKGFLEPDPLIEGSLRRGDKLRLDPEAEMRKHDAEKKRRKQMAEGLRPAKGNNNGMNGGAAPLRSMSTDYAAAQQQQQQQFR